MNTSLSALHWAQAALSKKSIDAPELTAELLLGFVLKLSRLELLIDPHRLLSAAQFKKYQNLITKRMQHIPLQHLLGQAPFLDFNLKVNANVLIPRPETEELYEFFVEQYLEKAKPNAVILDLGTGSGVLAIALARRFPNQIIYACDISQAALKLARSNAKQLGVENIRWYRGDFLEAFPRKIFKNPVWLVSNPPYIGLKEKKSLSSEVLHDPHTALFAGLDGLKAYQKLAKQFLLLLAPQSYFVTEMGYRQASALQSIYKNIFEKTLVHQDLSEHDRVFYAQNFHNIL
jgi:release factor glutamine methyltransferase